MKMSLMLCLATSLLLMAVADGTSSYQDARGGYLFVINTDTGLLLAVKDDNCYFVPLSDLRLSSYSAASFSAAEDQVIEMLTGASPAQVTLTSEVEMVDKYHDLLADVMCRGKIHFEYRVPDRNDCSPNPCLNRGTCHDGVNSYTCTCPSGYAGHRCETNIDDCSTNSCLHGGTCHDGVNSYTCTCPSGYIGDNCQTISHAPSDTTFHDTNHVLWKDCGGNDAWMTMTAFDMTPSPLVMGESAILTLHVHNGAAAFHGHDALVLNVTARKHLLNRWTTMPCGGFSVSPDNATFFMNAFQTCTHDDLCYYLSKLFPAGTCPKWAVDQGLPCSCPFTIPARKTVSITNQAVHLPLPLYSWLAQGEYYIKLVMYQRGRSEERMCLEFYLTFGHRHLI